MKIKKVYLFIFCFLAIALAAINFYYARTSIETEPVRAQETENQTQTETRATFGAMGDIVLSRNVAAKINKAKNPLLPFSKLSSLLQENDFNFANLESPFSGKDTFNPSPSMVFNAPRPNIKGLVANKFEILSIANNHALDQGAKGLSYTRTYLAQNDIKAIGAGNNLDQAWKSEVVEANGIKIGFIAASYASINDNGKSVNKLVARIEDLGKLKSAIALARQQADWVVVAMHAGTEYKYQPNPSQTKFARAAIDFGADMVIGGHPHWVETIEKYKGK
ncbi:MAG: CapA family protein, partial [Candidatus Komeilibacteria bacterium]|nr:CapA family protein [Candidatus Komeilibacteria bacterium]